ncbi:MAG: ScpA family protein [archaeon]
MEQQQIFDMLFNKDDITWQGIIYDLVRTEQMDPWDIDITLLAKKFLDRLKKIKEADLRISGKVVLASAILLKLKATKLMEEDINGLDSLIASMQQNPDDALFEEMLDYNSNGSEVMANDKPQIFPKTPQPRKRKVSVFDLVKALEKALEVSDRRKVFASNAPQVFIPQKPRDISLVIKDVYTQILDFFKRNKSKKLTFDSLLPSQEKLDKVYTFVPLLHLDNQRKIDLLQEEHFGEIEVKLVAAKATPAA